MSQPQTLNLFSFPVTLPSPVIVTFLIPLNATYVPMTPKYNQPLFSTPDSFVLLDGFSDEHVRSQAQFFSPSRLPESSPSAHNSRYSGLHHAVPSFSSVPLARAASPSFHLAPLTTLMADALVSATTVSHSDYWNGLPASALVPSVRS